MFFICLANFLSLKFHLAFYINQKLIFYCSFGVLGIDQIFISGGYEIEKEKI